MKNEKSFFETIIDAISWLKIVASPTILGIYWANKVSKKYGATNFISKVDASPDIDEYVKDKK